MITFLLTGLVLGLSSGFSPGPLLTLVIAESLQDGIAAGIKVALCPLITDLPIILVSIAFMWYAADFHWILGIISLSGSLFIFYLAFDSFRTKVMHNEFHNTPNQALKRGIIVNALNPHPYLFWITVGAPTFFKAMTVSSTSATGFILIFYICLVGAKIVLALIVSRFRTFLTGKSYIFIMRILGILLAVFAFMLLRDSLLLFGIIQ